MTKNCLEYWPALYAKGHWITGRMEELVFKLDRLAFPVRDDIPVMLEEEARPITEET